MQAPKSKPHTRRLSDLFLHTSRLTALVLVVGMVSLAMMDFSAKASEKAEGDRPSTISAETGEPEVDAAKSAPGAQDDALGNYRLAPGDRVSIVVFDEPQLSGEFFIDGGGDVLLPLAGSVRLSGLTLAEAQELIRKQFANGVLVQPAVSVRIKEYRPIFVTGDVKRPGSYRFMFGVSVKAAIATAGGEGQAIEQPLSVAVSDFVTAEERVRQLETDRLSLLVRKARLEAQRDERDDFVMPLLVGLNARNVNFQRAYSAESDVFHRLGETYRSQRAALTKQRPLIEAEIKAVSEQIANQNERLEIVNGRLADLEPLFRKGYLRKEVLTNQQIEKTLVQAQLSNLEAQVAHLRQTMGDLEVKLGEVKANQVRQILGELQEATQRLRVIDTILGPARKVRDVKAEAASGVTSEPEDYDISISRVEQGHMVTFGATSQTMLLPGDVVEVKLKRQDSANSESVESLSTEAIPDLSLTPASILAEGSASPSR
jgi:polysaccharide export outer membrane protein